MFLKLKPKGTVLKFLKWSLEQRDELPVENGGVCIFLCFGVEERVRTSGYSQAGLPVPCRAAHCATASALDSYLPLMVLQFVLESQTRTGMLGGRAA